MGVLKICMDLNILRNILRKNCEIEFDGIVTLSMGCGYLEATRT